MNEPLNIHYKAAGFLFLSGAEIDALVMLPASDYGHRHRNTDCRFEKNSVHHMHCGAVLLQLTAAVYTQYSVID
jgi:hypothetical protein